MIFNRSAEGEPIQIPYAEYVRLPDTSWNLVEKPLLYEIFKRFFKNFQLDPGKGIETPFGFRIPHDFSVLDLGTGTGKVAQALIEFGVRPENIVGVDLSRENLEHPDFPAGVQKIEGDVCNLDALLQANDLGSMRFNFIVSNMLFHLLSFDQYMSCLKQAKKYVGKRRVRLFIVVRHPFRTEIQDITQYHQQPELHDRAPWGAQVEYKGKSLQEYDRGIVQSGFSNLAWTFTTGVGLGLYDRYLRSDEAIWATLQQKAQGEAVKKIQHLRYWMLAYA